MGGTLAAASRAVESDEDRGRRGVAILYGANTLGAVTGCMASTFVLFETFGTRLTLWIACLINALVALTARSLVPNDAARPSARAEPGEARERAAPVWFTLSAAGTVGFVFCLMELVWYRMLGPVLGGTVFSFGLILALALLGIGLGGIAYGAAGAGPRGDAERPSPGPAWPKRRSWRSRTRWGTGSPSSRRSFARSAGSRSCCRSPSWAVVTSVVVLPAAFMSGVQFPLLIGLLGRGREEVGRDVGRTTATNALGAIAGSLAGGFGLIPALTAPGCWRLVVWLLVALGGGAIVLDVRRRACRRARARSSRASWRSRAFAPRGPTAAWRHSPIGAGRVDPAPADARTTSRDWEHARRRAIAWEADGRESSVALERSRTGSRSSSTARPTATPATTRRRP